MSEPPRPSERLLGIGGGLLSLIGPMSITILPPATPQLAAQFARDPADIGVTTASFLVGLIAAQLVCGSLSDRYGRRPVGLGFLTLYLLASLSCLLAATLAQLALARLFQGMGAAVGIAIARAMVRDHYVDAAAARIINLTYLVLGLGAASAPILGSVIVQTAGPQAVFLWLAAYGVAMMAYLDRCLPRPKMSSRRRRGRPPLLPYDRFAHLLRHGPFLRPALAVAGVSGALYGQSAVLPVLLMGELGLRPIDFAACVAAVAICHVIGSVSARIWLRRYRPHRVVGNAAVAILACCIWMALAALQGPSVIGLMGPIALAGFCAAHSYPILVTATVADLPEDAGAGASLLSCLQMGAGFCVSALAAWLLPSVWTAVLGLGGSLCMAGILGLLWAATPAPSPAAGAARGP